MAFSVKKAVIYARYSSNNQREESIEGQVRECVAYAQQKGYEIIETYVDRAMTARADNRPEFQRMISDSSNRQFQIVLTYQLDRFARNRNDSRKYKALLAINKVKVESLHEHISDDPEGILVESLFEGLAEYYSADLARKVLRGMRENALQARSAGGSIPFGYKLSADKHFIIDEEKASYVRKIYELYSRGQSIKDIVSWLNMEGVKTYRGSKFTPSSLEKLLRNDRYLGIYKWSDVKIAGGCPVIIEPELFECVQDLLKKKKKAPALGNGASFILSSKMVCASCGASYNGESGKGRNNVIHYYYLEYSQ